MRVDLEDLQRKSAAIRTELANMPQSGEQGQIAPPSAHQVSTESAMRLSLASLVVWMYQAWGTKEGERLAESLDATHAAYQAVDTASQQAINNGGGQPITVMTQPVSPDPVPAPPGRIPAPAAIAPGGFATPPIVQQQLDAGDQGASLKQSSDLWKGFAGKIHGSAPAFEGQVGDWEGTAADAAYAKFNSYRAWLDKLANSWEELSTEAARLADAHQKITEAHRPIAEMYEQAEKKLASATSGDQVAALFSEMQQAQTASEELIAEYAAAMSPKVIQPENPPNSGLDPTAATRDPNARDPQDPAERNGSPGGPGGPASGEPSEASPTTQPVSAPQSTGGQQAAGGSPSGGGAPSGGGSPSGGGAPSGGMPGGLPGGGPSTGAPKLPMDPSLKPAATGGGGGGAGAGGGGAGGGAPSIPLSPAVSAETVAPTAPTHAAAATPGAASSGGAAGGGMGGGMAPMHGAGHGNQGKEKRRDPNLSPDEDLYKEDRPWTEPVIGNRRRRDVQDGKEAT
jgi:hypothetical protein